MKQQQNVGLEVPDSLINGWNSIENAPKDGTWIFVYLPNRVSSKDNDYGFQKRKEIILAAYWSENRPQQIGEKRKRLLDAHGGYWTGGGQPIKGMPTHWMNIPNSPLSK